MFEDNKNFYPSPDNLIEKMLKKVDLSKMRNILEPSCGKGNIIDYTKEYYKNHYKRYLGYNYKVEDYLKFDAIELDENLVNLLRGKGVNVIDYDFLNHEPQRFYQLILMNPPFDLGTKHLIKAIEIQERIGGEVVCILNAESIKNTYSNDRKHLASLLNKYKADIEFIENAFIDSERETEVEVALIYVKVPMADTMTMFEKEFNRNNPDIQFDSFNTLVPNMNKLEKLIFEYDLIKNATLELYKEQRKISNLLNGMNLGSKISLCDISCHPKILTPNEFIDQLNLEYWKKFIDETDLRGRLPSKLRDNFTYNMEKQKDIAFNKENVRYFYEQLINSIPQSYIETVGKVFDDITHKYCYSETSWNQTIHLYSGWKTNQGMKINKRCIISCPVTYVYQIPDTLNDLNIIFENISGIKDDLEQYKLRDKIKSFEKKIETQHFILDVYKKGSMHIFFKNQEHLNQFNILSGKGKSWLPSDFGNKYYSTMSDDEKDLVKGFGLDIKGYDKLVMTQPNSYLKLLC